jgi:hypothetical protein
MPQRYDDAALKALNAMRSTRMGCFGARFRVPLMMVDSAMRAALTDGNTALDKRSQLSDAERLSLDSCKPGYRFPLNSEAAQAQRQKIRDSYKLYNESLVNSWRNSDASGEMIGACEGDDCTINGAPGHLREVDGELVCIADSDDDEANNNEEVTDGRTVNDREAAYAEHAANLRDAHKTLR